MRDILRCWGEVGPWECFLRTELKELYYVVSVIGVILIFGTFVYASRQYYLIKTNEKNERTLAVINEYHSMKNFFIEHKYKLNPDRKNYDGYMINLMKENPDLMTYIVNLTTYYEKLGWAIKNKIVYKKKLLDYMCVLITLDFRMYSFFIRYFDGKDKFAYIELKKLKFQAEKHIKDAEEQEHYLMNINGSNHDRTEWPVPTGF